MLFGGYGDMVPLDGGVMIPDNDGVNLEDGITLVSGGNELHPQGGDLGAQAN